MSAAVAIEWLSEAIRTGEVITPEDMEAARGVAAACDPEDAAVIRALVYLFEKERYPIDWIPMPAPRTPPEQRALDAALCVANAPDPHPHRSRPVRAVLDAAWNELCGGPKVDRVASARVMRSATPEDRSFLMTLRGMR